MPSRLPSGTGTPHEKRRDDTGEDNDIPYRKDKTAARTGSGNLRYILYILRLRFFFFLHDIRQPPSFSLLPEGLRSFDDFGYDHLADVLSLEDIAHQVHHQVLEDCEASGACVFLPGF